MMASFQGQEQVGFDTMLPLELLSDPAFESSQAPSDHPKQAATFLALPLELRDKIYENVYVPSNPNWEDRNWCERSLLHIAADCYPYLTCDLHLTCHSVLNEIMAFVQRQPKRRARVRLPVGTSREVLEGPLRQDLRSPFVQDLFLTLPIFSWSGSVTVADITNSILMVVQIMGEQPRAHRILDVDFKTHGIPISRADEHGVITDHHGRMGLSMDISTMEVKMRRGKLTDAIGGDIKRALQGNVRTENNVGESDLLLT